MRRLTSGNDGAAAASAGNKRSVTPSCRADNVIAEEVARNHFAVWLTD